MMATQANAPAAVGKASNFSYLVLAAGWLVPGAGHLMLRKWTRAALLFAAIATMFAMGLALGGKVYSPNTGDLLDILGFAGDLGGGVFYLIARMAGWGAAPVLTAVADYGTKFIVVGGMLNVIAAVDAHSIAIGRKRA
jgi:hypothetical protein